MRTGTGENPPYAVESSHGLNPHDRRFRQCNRLLESLFLEIGQRRLRRLSKRILGDNQRNE
jgi:hypothetical protein